MNTCCLYYYKFSCLVMFVPDCCFAVLCVCDLWDLVFFVCLFNFVLFCLLVGYFDLSCWLDCLIWVVVFY